MTSGRQILSEQELPMKTIGQGGMELVTDADSGASEGHLGQRLSPDAVSGASAL